MFFQAIDSIHQVGVYCLALVPANTLPKTPLGGIHISQTKQLFLEGSLHPCNILMCPHTCVTNLPKPRQKQPGNNLASSCDITMQLFEGRLFLRMVRRFRLCAEITRTAYAAQQPGRRLPVGTLPWLNVSPLLSLPQWSASP